MAYNRTLKHFTSSQDVISQWASSTNYVINQLIVNNTILYQATITHTSSGSFSTDLGDGKWTPVNSSIGGGFVPVGSIIAFSGGYFTASNNGGTYTDVLGNTIPTVNAFVSPNGFIVCDGTAPNDPLSPIFNAPGRFLPNLTDDRFLQGSTTAGSVSLNQNTATVQFTSANISTTGGAATFNKTVMNTNQTAHSHTEGSFVAGIRANISGTGLYMRQDATTTWASEIFAPMAATWASTTLNYNVGIPVFGSTDTASVSWASNTVTTTFTNPSFNSTALNTSVQSIDNRPTYLSILYIMRIK